MRPLALLITICLQPSPAAAQLPAGAEARIDSIFAQFTGARSPGCAVAVYREGEIGFARGYGLAHLELGVPITPATVFDIGSTSKQFTATAIVLLAQEGKLSLDDDVRRHVPELPDYGAPLTIRHLLHHTSGLRDYIALLTLGGRRTDDVTTAEDALRALARQRALNFPPGTEHLYSNTGYLLLSVIIERASGMSLRDFARVRIFQPLDMRHTEYLGGFDDVVPGRAQAYQPEGEGFRLDVSRWEQTGDGAVLTTVEDLLRWDRNFYDPRVGGPGLVEQLQTPGTLADGTRLRYAMGLVVDDYRGLRRVHHGGAWGGYRAQLVRFPERRVSVATLCNLGTADPTRLSLAVAEAALGLTPAPPAGATQAADAVPPSVLERYAGSYRDTATGETREISFADGVLRLGRFSLVPRGEGVFGLEGVSDLELRFEPSGGRPERLIWTVTVGDQQPRTYLAFESVALGPRELSAYTGTFTSSELAVEYSLSVEGDRLALHIPNAPPRTLTPTVPDEFAGGGLVLRFARAPDGRALGFQLGAGRVRGLEFVRADN